MSLTEHIERLSQNAYPAEDNPFFHPTEKAEVTLTNGERSIAYVWGVWDKELVLSHEMDKYLHLKNPRRIPLGEIQRYRTVVSV